MNNFWNVLGISLTTNRRDIQKAYAKLSKVYHPEEEPEKFKELQMAYQAALESLSGVNRDQHEFINLDATEKQGGPEMTVDPQDFHRQMSSDSPFDEKTETAQTSEDFENHSGEANYSEMTEDAKAENGSSSVFNQGYSDSKVEIFLSDIKELPQPVKLEHVEFIIEEATENGFFDESDFTEKLDAVLVSMRWKGKDKERRSIGQLAKETHLHSFADKVLSSIKHPVEEKKATSKWRSKKILVPIMIILFIFRAYYKVNKVNHYTQQGQYEIAKRQELQKAEEKKTSLEVDLAKWFIEGNSTFSIVEEDGKFYVKHNATNKSYEITGATDVKIDDITPNLYEVKTRLLVSDEKGEIKWIDTSDELYALLNKEHIKNPKKDKFAKYVDIELLKKQSVPGVYGEATSFEFAKKVSISDEVAQKAASMDKDLTFIHSQLGGNGEEEAASSDNNPSQPKFMVRYDVKGDDLVKVKGEVSAEDDAKIRYNFSVFTRLIPAAYRQNLSQLEIVSGLNDFTSIDFQNSSEAKQVLKINYEDLITSSTSKTDDRAMLASFIGEAGLILSLDAKETLHGRSYFAPLGKTFDGFKESAYLNQFYKAFWSKVPSYYLSNHLKNEEDVYAFYNLNEDKFLTIEGSLNPYNDFAHSFTVFAFSPVPTNQTDQFFDKLRFFYQFEELVALREQIIQNAAKIVETDQQFGS